MNEQQTDRDRIADLEARLAMVTLLLRRALMHYIPYTATIIRLQPGGGEISQTVPNPTRVEAEKALDGVDADVQAFLARVKRQGAAEELRRMADSLVGLEDGSELHRFDGFVRACLSERATELERE